MNNKRGRVTLAAGLAAGLVIVLAAGWFGFWWVARHSASNRYQVTTHTQGYQQSLIDQERDRVTAWDDSYAPAQKKQIGDTFCAVFKTLAPAPEDLAEAAQRICATS